MQVGSLDVAQDCLERYFLEQRRWVRQGVARRKAQGQPVGGMDQAVRSAHKGTGTTSATPCHIRGYARARAPPGCMVDLSARCSPRRGRTGELPAAPVNPNWPRPNLRRVLTALVAPNLYCVLMLCRYGPGMAPLEVRDQYLCRAHFATGLLVSERSKGLKVRPGAGAGAGGPWRRAPLACVAKHGQQPRAARHPTYEWRQCSRLQRVQASRAFVGTPHDVSHSSAREQHVSPPPPRAFCALSHTVTQHAPSPAPHATSPTLAPPLRAVS